MAAALAPGCAAEPWTAAQFDYDFARGTQAWTAGFADHPADFDPALYDLRAEIAPLPPELGEAGNTGFLLAGSNRCDDLFMFLARRLGPEDGIAPGASYLLTYELLLASNAQSNCMGIGGPPGEAVTIKVGGAAVEPRADVTDAIGWLRMNIGTKEPAVSVAGDIANGTECTGSLDSPYEFITRRHTHTAAVAASEQGQLWLVVATDSGFEGRTAIYYRRISVSLHRP